MTGAMTMSNTTIFTCFLTIVLGLPANVVRLVAVNDEDPFGRQRRIGGAHRHAEEYKQQNACRYEKPSEHDDLLGRAMIRFFFL